MMPALQEVNFVIVCSLRNISAFLLFETTDRPGFRLTAGGSGTEDCSSPTIMAILEIIE